MMVKAATVLALLVAIASVAPLAQARSAACTRPRKNAGAGDHSLCADGGFACGGWGGMPAGMLRAPLATGTQSYLRCGGPQPAQEPPTCIIIIDSPPRGSALQPSVGLKGGPPSLPPPELAAALVPTTFGLTVPVSSPVSQFSLAPLFTICRPPSLPVQPLSTLS